MKTDKKGNIQIQSLIRRQPVRQFGAGFASLALAGFTLASVSLAQTSIVCDPAGDPTYAGAKGGPKIAAWLDIVQAEVADAGSDIHFTLTLNAAVPAAPAWKAVDDGGQLWWGWRFVDDLANDTVVKDGCVKSAGSLIPAGYFLDLIWEVSSASFHARLLDDTTCAQNEVPYAFSSDRKQITMVVAKSLVTNGAIIPNPNAFEFFASTLAWKANKTGNNSFFTLDLTPNENNGQLVAVPWSASGNATYFCP